MAAIDKNNPTTEWIEELRGRFPIERECDRILTRKMQRRSGPGYSPVSLETLRNCLDKFLKIKLREPFEIQEANWLSGGASKIQVKFKLTWSQPGVGHTTTTMVLRMEPAESIVETSRLREFQWIKAMEGVVPVPPVYWIDQEGEYFPYAAIIYGFADGVAKPTGYVSNVTGLGINFGPEIRPILGKQFVEHLAAIHTMDWRKADLSSVDVPQPGTQSVEWVLNYWERIWEEDGREEIPLLTLARSWLRENMPPVDRLSVVHGDWRPGNFLYTEHDNRISAWLDWELAFLGDRHADLGYVLLDCFAHHSEDGKKFLLCGFMTADEMFEAYEKASGLSVDLKKVRYYNTFFCYRAFSMLVGTGYRVARNGKSHQDILLAWLAALGYMLGDGLLRNLEEVL